jgi:hypothetical protein
MAFLPLHALSAVHVHSTTELLVLLLSSSTIACTPAHTSAADAAVPPPRKLEVTGSPTGESHLRLTVADRWPLKTPLAITSILIVTLCIHFPSFLTFASGRCQGCSSS